MPRKKNGTSTFDTAMDAAMSTYRIGFLRHSQLDNLPAISSKEDKPTKRSSKKIDILESTDVSTINLNNLPEIIDAQIEQLSKIRKKVDKAMASALKASKSAEYASGMPTGIFKKKKALEALQSAGLDNKKAQNDVVEALKAFFIYETDVARITKFLLALGTYNVANTEVLITELTKKIDESNQRKKLPEETKQQLMGLINDLKSKKETQATLSEHKEGISQNAQDIDNLEEKDKEHDRLLAEGIEKDNEQDKLISEGVLKDQEQDAILKKMTNEIVLLKQEVATLKSQKTFFPLVSTVLAAVALLISVINLLI